MNLNTDLELTLLKRQMRKSCMFLIADWLLERDPNLSIEELKEYVHLLSKSLSPIRLEQ